jgi:hypothetical protein
MLLPGNDGGRSSMVEPQIVILVVAGSSPVGHPDSYISLRRWNIQFARGEDYKIVIDAVGR